jgi:hypothetical protein
MISPIPKFPFLTGRLNQFATIPIEGFNQSLADGVFEYVSKHGYHFTPTNHKKHIVVPPKKASKDEKTYSLHFRSLFKTAVTRDGVNDPKERDYYRFQTGPDDAPRILKECKSLQQIVNLAQINIDNQVKGYVAHKVSILYSLPNGQPQGFHADDYRSDSIAARDGPFLSVMVALQNDTKLDLQKYSNERNTYSIPMGTMFVFDGKLMHGGSAYKTHNLRVHIYFKYNGNDDEKKIVNGGENVVVENDGSDAIAMVFRCPVKDCDHRKRKMTFTEVGVYNHWKIHHREKEHLSLKEYEAKLEGTLEECNVCDKKFLTRERLEYHVWKEHKGPRPVFGCHKCEKRFLKNENLKTHLEKCHAEEKNL